MIHAENAAIAATGRKTTVLNFRQQDGTRKEDSPNT